MPLFRYSVIFAARVVSVIPLARVNLAAICANIRFRILFSLRLAVKNNTEKEKKKQKKIKKERN